MEQHPSPAPEWALAAAPVAGGAQSAIAHWDGALPPGPGFLCPLQPDPEASLQGPGSPPGPAPLDWTVSVATQSPHLSSHE